MPEPFVFSFALRSSDDALLGSGFRRTITREDFDTAPDDKLGSGIPILYGRKQSTGTNVTGMIEAIRCSTNGDPERPTTKPVRYLVSEGRLPDVLTRWTGGASQTSLGNRDTDWFWTNRNGHIYTEIGFETASDPGDTAVITVDAWGLTFGELPTSDPADDSQVMKLPTDQLRHYLANWVFNQWNDGTASPAYHDPFVDAPLDRPSWDAARGYYLKKNAEASRLVPLQSVQETVSDWGDSWQAIFSWTDEGKLGIAIHDPHTGKSDVYDRLTFLRNRDFVGTLLKLDTEVEQRIDRLRYLFFLADSQNELMASGTARDPHRNINREQEIQMKWGPGRESSL